MRNPKGNHLALTIVSLFGLFAWMNLVIATLVLPQLAKMLTGEENVFTLSGLHVFNSTFFAVTFALVYLALDPLVKTFYALRCFYVDARTTGEDLTSGLRALPAVLGCRRVPAVAGGRRARRPCRRPDFLHAAPFPRRARPGHRGQRFHDRARPIRAGRAPPPGIRLAFRRARPSRPTPAGPDPSGVSSTT